MSKKRTIVPIKDLDLSIFVRVKLNPDRVEYLAGLKVDGVELPPIGITPDMKVIYGRHRIGAYEFLDLKEIEAEVIEVEDEAELITIAYKENVGGALPPTQEDTEHTIEMLMDRKIPKKQIGAMLGLPPGLARTYLKNVQARITTKRLQAAATAIAKRDYTVARAAEEYSVDLERLKDFISGTRRKTSEFTDTKRRLISKNRSHSNILTALCKKLHERYEDGEFSRIQIDELFDLMQTQTKQIGRFINDYRSRFQAKADVSS